MIELTVVGLGPGDPDLVTIKGVRAIEAADVLFVPRSRADEESRALRIAQPWIDAQRQRVVPLTLPMLRDAVLSETYRAVATEIGTHLTNLTTEQQHNDTRGAYLLLGDPLLYGTWTSIAAELAASYPQITTTIVPGITSFAATAACTSTPLSIRDDRIAIMPVSAQLDDAYLRQLCADFETVVIMKVGRVLPQVIAILDDLRVLDDTIYAEYIGMPEERIVRDVASLRTYQGPYLSLLIVRRKKNEK